MKNLYDHMGDKIYQLEIYSRMHINTYGRQKSVTHVTEARLINIFDIRHKRASSELIFILQHTYKM